MRTQQRSFVVEIKSARRRLNTPSKSIWGNTDFAALVRDTEVMLPLMQNASAETLVGRGNPPLGLEKQVEVADLGEVGEDELREIPLKDADQVLRYQQDVVSTDSQGLKVAASEPKRRATKALKHRRARRESNTDYVSAVLPVAAAMDLIQTDFGDLAFLGAENLRLKQLLAEHLGQQNAQLKKMLMRFETA